MSEKYLPSTPLEARVRAGHFGEAIMPRAGVQPGPVYVYTAGIRIWHWVTMLAIIVLVAAFTAKASRCVTFERVIASPPRLGSKAAVGPRSALSRSHARIALTVERHSGTERSLRPLPCK